MTTQEYMLLQSHQVFLSLTKNLVAVEHSACARITMKSKVAVMQEIFSEAGLLKVRLKSCHFYFVLSHSLKGI